MKQKSGWTVSYRESRSYQGPLRLVVKPRSKDKECPAEPYRVREAQLRRSAYAKECALPLRCARAILLSCAFLHGSWMVSGHSQRFTGPLTIYIYCVYSKDLHIHSMK